LNAIGREREREFISHLDISNVCTLFILVKEGGGYIFTCIG